MNGSVGKYETAKGTRWFFVIELGRDAAGKRLQKRVRGFPTRKAARAAMEAELADRRAGSHVEPSAQPLAAYLAEWLQATAPTRSPNSNLAYASAVRARIVPHLGDVPLGALRPLQAQRWLNALAARYAPATVAQARHVLAQALAQAVAWRLIPRSPLAGTRRPAGRAAPKEAWTAEQSRRFLAHVADDPDHALWRLLLDGGLRIGEALALRWADVDLEAGVVTVRRTVTRDAAARPALGDDAKTAAGRRPVAIAPATAAALRAHRKAQAARRLACPAWVDLGLVFDRGDGGLRAPASPRGRLARLCPAAGVPAATPHLLRHTSITLAVLAGVPLKVVAERVGHRDIATTANAYSHVTREADRAAAEALARVLAG